MQKFLWIVLLLAATSVTSSLFSQSINFSTQSADLEVCGAPDTFRVTLNNFTANTLTNVQITIDNHIGVNYVPGSVFGFGIVESNVSDPDSIVFTSFDMPAFRVVDFYYLAQATCGSIDTAAISNRILVTHSGGADSTVSAPYNLSIPSLSIQQISPASHTGAIGDVFNRCVSIVNGGYGRVTDFTTAFQVDTTQLRYSNFTLAANGSSLTTTFSGDSVIIQVSAAQIAAIGNLDNFLDQNEVLEICYDVEIVDCDVLTAQTHHVYWGCDGTFCQSHSATAEVTVPVAVPNLTATRQYFQSTCYDNSTESVIKIIVTNNGAGVARDVEIELWQGNPNNFSSGYMSRFDTSRVEWKPSTGGLTNLTAYNISQNASSGNYACLGPNPVGRFFVTVPFIQPGEQDTLIVYQMACCKTWCGGSPSTSHRSFYKIDYQDECRGESYAIAPTIITSWNIGRLLSFTPNGPTDISPGDTAQFCLTHSYFRFHNYDAATAYAIADFILPANVNYTGLPGDLFFEDVQGDLWNPTSVTVIGDTVRAIFNLPQTPGFSLEKSNLKIRLVPDCSGGPCTGGASQIQYNLYGVPNTSCTCVETITCETFNINVHCGVCPADCQDGGLIFTDFTGQRTNYGAPDNDNNGTDDGIGSIDMTRVRTQYIMFGDTFATQFVGVVDTTTADPSWDAGSCSSTIPRGTNLTAFAYDIRIFDLSTTTYYNCALAAPTLSTSGTTRTFTYAWDTASLGPCLPNGFVFDEGDSIIVNAQYRMHRNPGSIVEGHTITNTFELTNTSSGNTAFCDSYSGSIVFVGYYFTTSASDARSNSGCGSIQMYENYYLSIGNCCSNYAGGNIFDYEYRHWAYLDKARVVMPPGYTFSSATISFTRTAGSQAGAGYSTAITPTNISNDTIFFDIAPEWTVNGGTFPMGDDGFYGTLRTNIIPGCGVESDVNQAVKYLWDFSTSPNITGSGAYTPYRVGRDSLFYESPSLALSAAQQVISGIDTTASWDFLMQNNSNVSDASNAWFALVSPTGQIVPYEVIDVGTGTMTPVNGIYQGGLVEADSARTFTVNVNYTNCSLDSLYVLAGWDCNGYPASLATSACDPDTFVLYLDPEPSEVQANLTTPAGPVDICDSIVVEIQVASSQLADVKDLLVGISLPVGGGLTFLPGSGEMEYPIATPFAPVIDPVGPVTSKLWVINSINNVIDVNNLPGITNPDSNAFTLRFTLETNCNFISGDRFVVQVRGRRACGDLMPPVTLISNPIDINGAVAAYSTQVISSEVVAAACPDRRTVSISVTNAGIGNTNASDSIFVAMPLNYGYAGGFTPVHNAPPVSAPFVQNLAGGVRIGWEMPPNTTPGDSIVFDFDIIVGPEVGCGTDIVNVQTVVNSNLFCAATLTNCNTAVTTGSQLVNVSVDRPNLDFTTFNAALAPQPGGWDYFFTGVISNTGAPLSGGSNTNVLFYCDTDNNGIHSPADVQIGTYSTTSGITSGSPHSMSGGFFLPNTMCNTTSIIYGMILPDTSAGYCICDTVFANSNAILPVDWLSVSGKAEANGNRVSWEIADLGDHDHFMVEKLDNSQWHTVSPRIQGSRKAYEWVDLDFQDREYYRIRQMDTDGASSYSSVVEIIRPHELETVSLYPNPARDRVHIDFAAGAKLRVTNALGQSVVNLQLDNDRFEIETSAWKAGVYFFKFNREDRVWVEKVVIE